MVPFTAQSVAKLPSIEAYRFAEARESRTGQVPIAMLERLSDRLPGGMEEQDAGVLDWRLQGTQDAGGRAALTLTLEGVFPLECQRCLKVLPWPVAQQTTVLLARTQEALVALDDESELEVVLCPQTLDLLALIEDELLLSLPFAPTHEEGCSVET